MITVGSLFDGSGGFPLAGALCGAIPVWASEVEPYCIAVTKTHFPNMKHLGNISEINGAEIQPVDIITGGSPCQDLSVAGQQKGIIDGSRSRLFFEMMRIIKEMREATHGQYPKFVIWENVAGAFSSNKGDDFWYVLKEFVEAAGFGGAIPRPTNGKWQHAGEILGDEFSIAWRLFDAQYWGVPQRRRRIYLVADFRGQRAGKILFERGGLPWSSVKSGEAWQEITRSIETRVGATGKRGGLNSSSAFCPELGARTRGIGYGEEQSPTLRTGATPAACVQSSFGFDGYNSCETGDVSSTLGSNCGMSTGRNGVAVYSDTRRSDTGGYMFCKAIV